MDKVLCKDAERKKKLTGCTDQEDKGRGESWDSLGLGKLTSLVIVLGSGAGCCGAGAISYLRTM